MVLLLGVVLVSINGALCCDLLPGNPSGSCLNLVSSPYLTSSVSNFGPFIEGASVNPRGEIFAVNFGDSSTQNTLGQAFPIQRLFYSDPIKSSLFNGIRFLNASIAYVVDAVNHRVLKLDIQNDTVRTSGIFCSDPKMIQPNDLTLSLRTGVIVTSGMKMANSTNNTSGDIWSCLPSGEIKRLEAMGRTNGIDLSPCETILYVSESYTTMGTPYVQKIWKYNFNADQGSISGKTLFVDFSEVDGSQNIDIDGVKTDLKGNLYVSRAGSGQVAIFNAGGNLIGKIRTSFSNPTNLEFGGVSGKDLFIVGKCNDSDTKGCVDRIELAYPGRAWYLLQTK